MERNELLLRRAICSDAFFSGVSSAAVIVLEKVVDFCSETIYFTNRDKQRSNDTGFVVDCHLYCFLLPLVLFVAAAVLKLCLIYGFDFSLNICDVLATLREIVCVKTALCLYLMPEKSTSASTFRLSMLIILIAATLVPNAVAVRPGEDTTLSCASTVMDLATIAGEIARTYRHQPSSQNHTKNRL